MKNTLCIENYGVVPMTTREMRTIDGGVIPVAAYLIGSFIAGLVVGYCIVLANK